MAAKPSAMAAKMRGAKGMKGLRTLLAASLTALSLSVASLPVSAAQAVSDDADLIRGGRHVLVAYIMRPKPGYGFLATDRHRHARFV